MPKWRSQLEQLDSEALSIKSVDDTLPLLGRLRTIISDVCASAQGLAPEGFEMPSIMIADHTAVALKAAIKDSKEYLDEAVKAVNFGGVEHTNDTE